MHNPYPDQVASVIFSIMLSFGDSFGEYFLPDGLDALDCNAYSKAKLSAIHLSPHKARKLIKEGASNALLKLKHEPQAFSYPKLTPPYVLETKFRANGDKTAHLRRGEHPDSIIGLLNMQYRV